MASPTPPLTPSRLPSGNAASLKLVIASPQQARQCWGMNSVSWRGPLSQDAYIRREHHLGSQDMTKDGGATYWILIDENDGDPSDPWILSSCESYRKRAFVSQRPATTSTTTAAATAPVEEVVTHGVGSVYCRDDFRGKGYAVRMMAELRKNLETWQQQPGKKSALNILFSDIGKKFYARNGWHPFPSRHVDLAPLPGSEAPQGTRPIYTSDLPDLCATDEAQMMKHLGDFSQSSAKIRVGFPADKETFQWIHSREEFIGKEMGKTNFEAKGVLIGDKISERVWCIWTRKFALESEERILYVLRIMVEDGASEPVQKIATCLQAAQQEAASSGLDRVQLWNPSRDTEQAIQLLTGAPAVLVDRQDESIASLLWYGSEITPQDIEWVDNEKYGWN